MAPETATAPASQQRTLPHNLEAERSVLGAILIDNDTFNIAAAVIEAKAFFRDAHRRIYERMMDLSERSQPIDLVTLKEELERAGELEEVGGPAYIASLVDGVPRSTNVEYYAQIVKEKATLRNLIFSANKILGTAYEADQEADLILDEAESAIFAVAEDRIKAGFVPMAQLVRESFPKIERLFEHKTFITGVPTGFDDMYRLMSGQIGQKEYGQITHAMETLSEAKLFVDDTAGIGALEMRAKARRLKAEHGLSVLAVDYIQLMTGRGRFENRTLELASISRSLKGLAKELSVPIVVLSQLSRAPEARSDKRPMLSDLRESGALEQDADVVALIFREEMYKVDDQPADSDGVAEIIIAKQRNGPTGTVKLAFIREQTRFGNLAGGYTTQDDN